MYLDQLTNILPIHNLPIDVCDTALATNLEQLGVELPEDYLAFSKLYGSGTIVIENDAGEVIQSWEIFSAFRPTLPRIVSFFQKRFEAKRDPKSRIPQIELFPKPGGLLPFGGRNSDYIIQETILGLPRTSRIEGRDSIFFTWQTTGKPDDWKVVVFWDWDRGLENDKGHQKFELGFYDFLVQLLTRRIKLKGSKAWTPEDVIRFIPRVYSG